MSKLKLDMGALKLDKIDVRGVTAWARKNAILVACVAVGVLAPLAGWWVASSMREENQRTAEEHAAKMQELAALEKRTVTLAVPGRQPQQFTTLLNQKLIDSYESQVKRMVQDSGSVRQAAIEFNRHGRGAAFDLRAAAADPTRRRQMHLDAYDACAAAWTDLLAQYRVGAPPPPEEVIAMLQRRRAQYITGNFKKPEGAPLNDAEQAALREELAKARVSRYAEAASAVGLYGDGESMGMPMERPAAALDGLALFAWQWKLWIVDDLLAAFTTVNGGAAVAAAPVKRVNFVGFPSMPSTRAKDGPDAGAPADGTASPGVAIDPAAKVPDGDFSLSFTGRSSNQLYDVQVVDVQIVAETAKLPAIFDALAKRNFITILNIAMEPADPFEAANEGYIYGPAPVSTVSLRLETIWLREWVAPFMPDDLRQALGTTGALAGTAPSGS